VSASSHANVYHGTLLDEIIHEQKLSRELVKKAARELFGIIKEGLLRDGVVRINHFGSFKLKRVAARKGRNPKTGEPLTIQGHAKVIFTPCKALREMIEPVHAKPIPVVTTAPKSTQASVQAPAHSQKSIREAIQAVPELIPEPALLRIESEARFVIERVSADEGDEPVAEESKRALYEKVIYFGIAATIIAVVIIKSMPGKVSQSLTVPSVSERSVMDSIIVTELEIKPVEVAATPLPVMERPIVELTEVISEIVTEQEPESELAQIIASQSEQLRVELEVSSKLSPPVTLEEGITEIEGERVAKAQQPITESITEETVEAPVVATVTTAVPPEQTAEFFFTKRPYKLLSGNSLWRLSKHFYNEPLYWPHIFYANSDTITNPDRLREGRTITMPTLEGAPGSLTVNDREGIAEGYFLTYSFYRENGHPDAFFALLEAKRYSAAVVERKRHTLTLSKVENIMLDQQEMVANL